LEHQLQVAYESLLAGGPIVYPLLGLGVLALAIILDRGIVILRSFRLPEQLRETVETYRFEWTDLERRLAAIGPKNAYVRFLAVIARNRNNPAWWVESRANDEAAEIERVLSRGQWMLETIVTAAPLMGLLGTITGMMDAFRIIGGSGLVAPTRVTGGVAEALIATALGLLIALIALFGFNLLSRIQTRVLDEMERMGSRLVDHIRLDQEGMAPEVAPSALHGGKKGAGHEAA
jgi:biopolymer transport protein ExbB